jgi:hypothetical protein
MQNWFVGSREDGVNELSILRGRSWRAVEHLLHGIFYNFEHKKGKDKRGNGYRNYKTSITP